MTEKLLCAQAHGPAVFRRDFCREGLNYSTVTGMSEKVEGWAAFVPLVLYGGLESSRIFRGKRLFVKGHNAELGKD
jgi:hypothetical protein